MSGTKPTPGPWKVFTTPNGEKLVGIGELNGSGIADCGFGLWRDDPEALANARLIVRAVNCHADLVAALRLMRERLIKVCDDRDLMGDDDGEALRITDAALAKAGETE